MIDAARKATGDASRTAAVRDRGQTMAEPYGRALRAHLARPDEITLQEAQDIGQRASATGLSVSEMTAIHCRTLLPLVDGCARDERAAMLAESERFLAEAIAPFEMSYRGVRDANVSLGRLNAMLEDQAKQIAYVLHDEVTQILATSHLRLAEMAKRLPPPGQAEVGAVRGLLDQIEERVRGLARDLRPTILDDLGLVPALRFLAENASKRWGLSVSVAAFLDRRLPAILETVLYRVTQEALTNVGRHAGASQAQVWVMEKDGVVLCSVRDDGVGFDAAAVAGSGLRGLGLAGIEERVAQLDGTVHIAADRGRGTEIVVEIPVEPRHVDSRTAGR